MPRFKKPTDEDLMNLAFLVSSGNSDIGIDVNVMAAMCAMTKLVIDRLYDNGDISIPCKDELSKLN